MNASRYFRSTYAAARAAFREAAAARGLKIHTHRNSARGAEGEELTTDVARSIYGTDGLKEAFSEAMTSTSIAPVQFLPRTPTNAQQAP